MSVHLDINITWAQIGINQNPPRLALETHIPHLPRHPAGRGQNKGRSPA